MARDVVYKPKDLRLDVAWHDLIERLNRRRSSGHTEGGAAQLRGDGYGWTEFIDHTGCADAAGCARFFRRAGAWLALLHAFAATDMHQENMIAAGEHPVPIDLETILQPSAEEHKAQEAEGEAFDAAMDIVANSVMTVGLLPAYGRSVDNNVFAMGGMTADWNSKNGHSNGTTSTPTPCGRRKPRSQARPHRTCRMSMAVTPSSAIISRFRRGLRGLRKISAALQTAPQSRRALFDGFAGVPVRKVIRPTRFYYMLLQRLKDHRTMDDGAIWSAQADFIARLAEWDKDADPLWPLQRAERSALLALNVPHFVSPSDGDEITRCGRHCASAPRRRRGLERARARVQNFDEQEIAWQIEVIRENTKQTDAGSRTGVAGHRRKSGAESAAKMFCTRTLRSHQRPKFSVTEADRIAAELSRLAIRRGPGAAWIGLDWLGDSEVFQLVCLGPDLYNGVTGIAVFLAAHAAVTGCKPSGELALAGLSHLRKNLKSRNAARMARSLGIGGATGLGSVVYAFAVMAKCLHGDRLARGCACGGATIHRRAYCRGQAVGRHGRQRRGDTGAASPLSRQLNPPTCSRARRNAVNTCWANAGSDPRAGAAGSAKALARKRLNGMSHGAAGFAYALAALAAATGREEFAQAAAECMAFENSSYDAARHNWPDLRGGGEPLWACQWCHGAPGIGLARMAMAKRGGTDARPAAVTPVDARALAMDIGNALAGVEQTSPLQVDTLCCGTLGGIEFFCEAADALERGDLRDLAARRLMAVLERAAATGDYRWNSGKRQFNLGLFRGLAGVGYTLLRQIDASLPNIIIWE